MPTPKKISLIFILLIFFTPACATQSKRAIPTKEKPLYKRPATQIPDQESSPAEALVSDGVDELKRNDVHSAEWKFEEAIVLDPDYGPAYYWLARARYRLKQIQEALELLDKAQKILRNSEVWLNRIEKFRNYLWEKLGN